MAAFFVLAFQQENYLSNQTLKIPLRFDRFKQTENFDDITHQPFCFVCMMMM